VKITARTVNAELASLGYSERIVQARTYVYFVGDGVGGASDSIPVYRVGEQPPLAWAVELEVLLAVWKAKSGEPLGDVHAEFLAAQKRVAERIARRAAAASEKE
jgi:hypothetical protein